MKLFEFLGSRACFGILLAITGTLCIINAFGILFLQWGWI